MWNVCFVLNHTYDATIKNIPLNISTGSACYMSPFLRFYFWGPVFFNTEDASLPRDVPEERGRFVGISETLVMT